MANIYTILTVIVWLTVLSVMTFLESPYIKNKLHNFPVYTNQIPLTYLDNLENVFVEDFTTKVIGGNTTNFSLVNHCAPAKAHTSHIPGFRTLLTFLPCLLIHPSQSVPVSRQSPPGRRSVPPAAARQG